jgi:hypothetical protein
LRENAVVLTSAHIRALRPQLGALAEDAVAFANAFRAERTWTRIVSRSPGSSQTSTGQRPDVEMVQLQTAMRAEAFPAFDQLFAESERIADSAALFTDAAGNAVPAARRRAFLDRHLAAPFLTRYMNRSPYPIDLSAERVELAAAALADELETADHRYVEVRPLLNIVLTADEIPLGGAMRLRRVNDEEVVEWLNQEGMSSYLPPEMALHVFAALERRYVLPVGMRQELPPVERLALFPPLIGLMADADCRVPMIEQRCIDPDYGLISRSGGGLPPTYGRRGTVRPEDGARLVRWAERADERGKELPLALAMRRWQDGTNRGRPDDQLIDYWIALEALFASDGHAELKFRCSLRIAAYIGVTTDERVAVYKEMRGSYDCRSALVHGDEPKVNVTAVAGRTRDCLRRALVRLLDTDEFVSPITSEEDLLRRG